MTGAPEDRGKELSPRSGGVGAGLPEEGTCELSPAAQSPGKRWQEKGPQRRAAAFHSRRTPSPPTGQRLVRVNASVASTVVNTGVSGPKFWLWYSCLLARKKQVSYGGRKGEKRYVAKGRAEKKEKRKTGWGSRR